jgi:hypothetical protein
LKKAWRTSGQDRNFAIVKCDYVCKNRGEVFAVLGVNGNELARIQCFGHPFIDDLKMKDFVTSVPLSEEQICSAKLMRDFVSACRKMSPLVEFSTKALGLKF